jgi:hypothetical protein
VLQNPAYKAKMMESLEQANIDFGQRYFPSGASQSISRHLLSSQLSFDVVRFLDELQKSNKKKVKQADYGDPRDILKPKVLSKKTLLEKIEEAEVKPKSKKGATKKDDIDQEVSEGEQEYNKALVEYLAGCH